MGLEIQKDVSHILGREVRDGNVVCGEYVTFTHMVVIECGCGEMEPRCSREDCLKRQWYACGSKEVKTAHFET